MFIAPRDVCDGGEGSHGTYDTEYSGTERSPQLRRTFQHNLPLIDINTRDSDRYRHPRRGHAASTDTRSASTITSGLASLDAVCPLRGCLYLSEVGFC